MSKWDKYPKLDGNWLWVSASQISKYLACPRMWWWEYRADDKDKRRKPPKTKALEIGIQHASELEEYLKGERSEDQLMPLARKGIHLLPEPGSNILVEEPFWIDIHKGKAPFDIPAPFDGVRILGAIDLIDLNAVERGWIYIDDHKSCKSGKWAKKADMLESDIQMQLYGFWASRIAPRLGILPAGQMVRLGWINYPKNDEEAHRVNAPMSRDNNIEIITGPVFGAIEGMLEHAAKEDQHEVIPNTSICRSHFGGCWHGVKASPPHCTRSETPPDPSEQPESDAPKSFSQLFDESQFPEAPSPDVNNFESDVTAEVDTNDVLPPESRALFEKTLTGTSDEEPFHMDNLEGTGDPEYTAELPEGFQDRALSELDLPTRALTAFTKKGLQWASEIVSFTREQLLDMKGLGEKTVTGTMEIIESLREDAQEAQASPEVQTALAEQISEQKSEPRAIRVTPEQTSEALKEPPQMTDFAERMTGPTPVPVPMQPAGYTLCIDCYPLGGQKYTDLDIFYEACCTVYEVANAKRPEATQYKAGLVDVREFAAAVARGEKPETLSDLGPVPKEHFVLHSYVVLRSQSDADRLLGGLFRMNAALTIKGTR